MKKLISFCLMALLPTVAMAWGERGHDIITQTAATLYFENYGDKAAKPFQVKRDMLGHLSNIPDIHWRSNAMTKEQRDANAPTHFIDINYIYPEPLKFADIELDISANLDRAKKVDLNLANQVGTAPWRVDQLQTLIVKSLSAAKAADKRDVRNDHINNALMYAGLQSHFVGDLANPHHTTKDYDGYEVGQGGLHSYFETIVVAQLKPQLHGAVYDKAKTIELSDWYRKTTGQLFAKASDLELTFALVTDSFNHLDQLLMLDKTYALKQPSRMEGDRKIRAVRNSAVSVMDNFRPFIEDRMALGAAVQAALWHSAWLQAGKPDLSEYQSYHYWFNPDFVVPDYTSDKPQD